MRHTTPWLRPSRQTSSPDAEAPGDIISVSSLNRMARSILEGGFPAVRVEGEISNLATPGSGHWYLTLKDERAQIRCCMFRNRNMMLRFRPRNGMQIVVHGRLSLYEARGDYQLIAEGMEEAGDGRLRRAFEELKNRLSAEGLFDPESRKAVGNQYRHIGVVTSPTGAAVRDIMTVFRRRFPSTLLTIFPVPVQGSEAPPAIVRALDTANRRREELGIEALVIARGGGSLEDLQAFYEESVARAIHASALPVVSAVGHETDFSISDFVADLRAATPSAAAELLSPDQQEYCQALLSWEQKLAGLIRRRIGEQRQHLLWLTRQLRHPGRRLQGHAQRLDELEARLRRATRHRVNRAASRVQRLQGALMLRSPGAELKRLTMQQENLERRLMRAMSQNLSGRRAQLSQLGRSLDNISPLATLSRGYSITYDDRNRVLRDIAELSPGSTISTRVQRGRILSTVTELLPNDDSASGVITN